MVRYLLFAQNANFWGQLDTRVPSANKRWGKMYIQTYQKMSWNGWKRLKLLTIMSNPSTTDRVKSTSNAERVGSLVRPLNDVLQKIREHFWREIRTL